MLSHIGTTEVIVLSVVLILLFGGRRVPEFVRQLSYSIKEFRQAVRD